MKFSVNKQYIVLVSWYPGFIFAKYGCMFKSKTNTYNKQVVKSENRDIEKKIAFCTDNTDLSVLCCQNSPRGTLPTKDIKYKISFQNIELHLCMLHVQSPLYGVCTAVQGFNGRTCLCGYQYSIQFNLFIKQHGLYELQVHFY